MMDHVRTAVVHSMFWVVLILVVPAGAADLPRVNQAPSTESPISQRASPATSSNGGLDLDALKRRLSEVTVEPPPAPPLAPPETPARGESVTLTLEQSVELAVKRNLGLRVTTLDRDSARFQIPKLQARYHPTVGFALTASGVKFVPDGTAVTREYAQRLTPILTQELPTGGSVIFSADVARIETRPGSSAEQFGSGLTISLVQPLLRGGRVYVATQPISDAKSDLRIATERLRADMLGVTARTKAAYYTVLLAEKVIGVTEASIDRDRALIAASQALFAARLVTRRDVFSAELSLAQDTARLVSARADLENARNALLNVLGLPIGTDLVLLDKEISFEPVPVDVERWIATALSNRPEILQIEERLAKSRLAIRVAENALLPQLDLVGSYGRSDTRSTFPSSLAFATEIWTAGLVFSIPVGNVAARSALAQAEIEQTRLHAELEQTRRQIELEVRAAGVKLRKSVERMKSLITAIEQAKGKLEVGKAQFALGQATNLDITDAQQAILNAETDLLTAIVDYNVGLAELEASLAAPFRRGQEP
jgi:outer membrane protein TolC